MIALGMVCIMLAMGLCGCSKPSDSIVGTWKGTVDMNDQLGGTEDDQLIQSMLVGDVSIDFIFDFESDGTYTVDIDATKLKDALKNAASGIAGYLLGDVDALVEPLVDNLLDNAINSSFDKNGQYKVDDSTGEVFVRDSNGKFEKAFTFSDGKLVMEEDGKKVTFSKVG